MKNINRILNYRVLAVILMHCFAQQNWAQLQKAEVDWTDHSVEIGNVDLHYRKIGKGPAILLLHGFTLTGEQWLPFVEELAADYTLIIPDLPMHGKSQLIEGSITSHEPYASVMLGLMDHLNIKEVRGIGHSMGAITLLNMEYQRPGIIQSMILVAGGLRFTPDVREYLMGDSFDISPKEFQEYYLRIHPGRKEIDALFELERNWASIFPTRLADSNIDPVSLAGMDMPVYLIWGDRDMIFPIEIAVELYKSLPNSRLWIIPGQDHLSLWPQFGGDSKASEIFSAQALSFFKEIH